MEEPKKNMLSLLQKIKQKAETQTPYGGEYKPQDAKMDAADCPNCGAGRAKQDGLTHCAYCGFEFISVKITGGLHLSENDNSRENKKEG